MLGDCRQLQAGFTLYMKAGLLCETGENFRLVVHAANPCPALTTTFRMGAV